MIKPTVTPRTMTQPHGGNPTADTIYTQDWTDKQGHHHIDTFDSQHHLTQETSCWTDAQGRRNRATLSHLANGGVGYSHAVLEQDGRWNKTERTRQGQVVTQKNSTLHADNTWAFSYTMSRQGHMVSQETWHYDRDQPHAKDDRRVTRLGNGATVERSWRQLSDQTYDVLQRTRGADGQVQQEWESTQQGNQRFAGHHYRHTPQGVERQTWVHGPGGTTPDLQRLQQSLGMFEAPDTEAYDATA